MSGALPLLRKRHSFCPYYLHEDAPMNLKSLFATVPDKLRAWPALVVAIIAITIVATIAPYQIGVLVWSLSKLALGAYLGYWVDRCLFPYARPHTLLGGGGLGGPPDYRLDLATLRRAIIVAAALVSMSLGV
ncbi:MAG: putative holin [Pseudomonadales bacterium]|nr:putative holin [Pseudomonadales bacterium]